MGSAGEQGALLFPSGVQANSAVGQAAPQHGSGHPTNGSSLSKAGWPSRVAVSQQRSWVLMGCGGLAKQSGRQPAGVVGADGMRRAGRQPAEVVGADGMRRAGHQPAEIVGADGMRRGEQGWKDWRAVLRNGAHRGNAILMQEKKVSSRPFPGSGFLSCL